MHTSGFLQSMTFNRFILLLCGIYIGMVVFIHNRLQTEHPSDQLDLQYKSQIDDQINFDIVELKTWVKTQKDFHKLSHDIKDLQVKVKKVKQQIEDAKKESPSYFSDKCVKHGHEDNKNNSFLILERGVFVYSAYLDNRKNDVYIRIMVILEKTKKKVPIFCHTKELTIVAKQYEMCENHNKQYGGYIYSCELPKNRSLSCPLYVSSTFSRSSSQVSLPLVTVRKVPSPLQFGICISPLFGDVPAERLVEFIELSQVLGAKQFYFYVNNISSVMTNVLEHYKKANLVSIIPWELPHSIPGDKIWYHGQLIAHNDCLYRTMGTVEHVIFNDIDEFIVPHTSAKYWSSLFPQEFRDQYCAIAFSSAFYDPGIGLPHPSGLQTMSLTGRTKRFSHVRTKIMVMPSRVFEVGIHHVSKQNEEKWSVMKYKPDLAYIHHYRQCIGNYGMKCNQFEKDNTMLKYYDDVVDKFEHSIEILNIKLHPITVSNLTKHVL